MDTPQPPVIRTPAQRRLSVFLKIGGICLLIVALHIPLELTRGVLVERQGYQVQADREIAETWGQSQLVSGPLLMVPWSRPSTRTRVVAGPDGKMVNQEEEVIVTGSSFYLPEALTVNAALQPEIRYRGIYDSVVYAATLTMSGQFVVDRAADALPKMLYHWDRARLFFGVSDLRRLRANPQVEWAGDVGTVESNVGPEATALGLAAAVKVKTPGMPLDFSITMQVQGSGRLEVSPVGKQTKVTITSPWSEPSFTGAALPTSRMVSAQGFTATWEQGPYGRDYPFAWDSRASSADAVIAKFPTSALGVVLAKAGTGYGMVDRARKYGVLFFVLVFAVFFLFEVTAALRIHPLQYALVGAALALFFLGFLALSEFLSVGLAYGIAAAACTAMVALYAWSFLRTGRRTLVIGGGLGATYGYLYFVLRSQDYALVAGTVALFAALALVMFCTRRINWYELDSTGEKHVPARS